jgi:hypothetical protein
MITGQTDKNAEKSPTKKGGNKTSGRKRGQPPK